MGQITAAAFQAYDPSQAGSITPGPFALYTVSVDSLDATQMNEGYSEVNYKTSGFDNLAPGALNTYLLGYIEPVVIGPGGQLYLLDGHHTFTALENSVYGASNPTVYVNVVANYSSLTTAQFWTQMEAMNTVLALNEGVPQAIDPATGLPLPTALTGLSNDPYRGLEYSILKNKSSALFTTTANITGAVGASTPGLDKVTGFYSDFIWAAAYRNALGGKGLPFLSPGDIALAAQWNLNGANTTTIPGTGTVTVAQLPGFILGANIAISSTISDTTLSTGTIDGNGGFTGITSFSFGSITLGTVRSGLVLQLGNDKGFTVTLTGANTYTGGTTLLAGTLIISSDASLGAAPPATTTIDSSAIIASVDAANGIVFNGLTEGNPTLVIGTTSGAGTSTFSTNRAIAVDGEIATINLNGYLATFTGPIVSVGSDGTGLGYTAGVSDITINDTSSTAKGVFYLAPTSASANAGFYGNWIISAGTLNVTSDAAMGNTSGPSYEVGQIVLNGGIFQAGASFSSVRSLQLTGGSSYDTAGYTTSFAGSLTDTQRVLTVTNTSTTTAGSVTFGSFIAGATASLALALPTGSKGETVTLTGGFVRQGNATVLIQSTGAGLLGGATEKVLAGTAPTLINGIVSPWIISDNSGGASANPYDFVTYGANGFVKAAYTKSGSSSSTGIRASAATDIVEETGSTALSANAQAFALKIDSGFTITATGYTLTLGNGTDPAGLILSNSNITGGTLAFGASEAIIYAKGASNTISSVITGSNGLTFESSNTLVLSSAENLSGAVNIDSGLLSLTAANVFAGDAAGVTLYNVKSSPAAAAISFTANQTFTTLNSTGNNSAITFSNGAALTIGTGATNLGSTLSSNITETGTTVTGALTFNGTGLFDLSGISSNKLVLVAGSTIVVNGGQLRLVAKTIGNSNTITTASGAEVQFAENGGDVWAGNVAGAGDVRLISGTLKETGTGNTYSGGTFVEVGATLDLTTANVSSGNANIGSAGGTIVFDQATNGTYNGVISDAKLMGTGNTLSATLIKDDSTTDNAGIVTISQAQTFTGSTYIEAGGIELGAADALIDSAGVVLGRVGGGATASLKMDANEQLAALSSDASNTASVVLNGHVLTLAPGSAVSSNFGGVISDGSAAGGALVVAGAGTVTLTGADTYTGGTTINSGTLELGNASAAGAGAIAFATGANATLQIDAGVTVGNTITGFAAGETIDLAGVAYDAAGGATLVAGNVLDVTENGNSYGLNLDPSASFAGDVFHVASDGNGGVAITLEAAPTLSVNAGSTAPIGAAGDTSVGFALTGLVTGDTGTVIFTDSANNTVTVDIGAGQTSYTADLSGLTSGPITSQLSLAGNSFTAPGNSVTLDTVAPTVDITSTGGLTNQTSQSVTGTVDVADAGTTVTVYDGTTALGTATTASDGSWSTSVTLSGDGTHVLTASDSDAAGNTGISGEVSYILDTSAPTVDITSTGGVLYQTAQTVHGTVDTADAGSTVTVYDGTTVLGTATVASDGTWSTGVTFSGNGTHTVTASDTDAAGNTGTSAPVAFTISAVPAPTGLADAAIANGYVNIAHDTGSQTLTGTAIPAATVTVYNNGVLLGTVVTNATTGQWSYKLGKLATGTYSLTAVTTKAGHASLSSSPLTFTVLDDKVPAPTGLADAAIAGGYVNATGNTSAQVLTGTAQDGSTITITINGVKVGTTTTANMTVGTTGTSTWSYNLGVLATDTYKITATATDVAGNVSAASAALNFKVIATAPDAPTALADSAVANGYVNHAHDTAAQTLTGTAGAGDTVAVYDEGVLMGTAKANAAGAWKYKLGVLDSGAHALTATATDVAGNLGATSSALTFTVDTVAPVPALINMSYDAGAGLTTVSGVAEANDVVTIIDNGTAVGSTVADATGAWTYAASTLGTGLNKYTATCTDAAGNIGKSTGYAMFNPVSGAKVGATATGGLMLGAPGDTLNGNAGVDTFIFHAGFGKETVTNFTTSGAAPDVLQFDHSVFADWAHLLGATHQQGSDLAITLDGSDVITLKNVSLASFTQSNAHFV